MYEILNIIAHIMRSIEKKIAFEIIYHWLVWTGISETAAEVTNKTVSLPGRSWLGDWPPWTRRSPPDPWRSTWAGRTAQCSRTSRTWEHSPFIYVILTGNTLKKVAAADFTASVNELLLDISKGEVRTKRNYCKEVLSCFIQHFAQNLSRKLDNSREFLFERMPVARNQILPVLP